MLRWIYRFVVLALPAAVRREYGHEMEDVFLFCVTARRQSGGWWSGAGAVIRGLADGLAFAASARWGRARPTPNLALPHVRSPRTPPMRKQDLTAALRFVRHQPLFAAAIVLMLALGMGATTALFSVVYGVLLQPLAFPEPDRLVSIAGTRPDRGWDSVAFTEANFWDFADMTQSFSAIGAWHGGSAVVTDGAEPERLDVSIVSSGYLRALGVQPVRGHIFTPEDDRPAAAGAARPIILSHALWQRRYGADPDVVGKTIMLGSGPRTIVGVLPSATPFLQGEQLFVPLVRRPNADRGSFEYQVIARLKPGVTMATATADIDRVAKVLEHQYPEDTGLGAVMSPSSTWVASTQLREMLWALLGSVGLLLVIACVNVTNLLLARASARARESAVRTAIGARRADLVREWLVESLLLSGLAMIVGLAITVGLLQAVRVWGPTGIPRLAAVSVNGWVFAAACAIALVVGIATGLVPALQTPVADIVTALRHGQRGSVGDRHHDRLRRLFVAAEVALSVVLLVGAGLLVRSLTQVLAVDRGFQTDHRLVVNVAMPGGYPQPKAAQTSRDILDRIRAMPQVQSVAFVSSVPLGPGSTGLGFAAADKPDDGAAVPWATWRVITPDYFQTMGVPLLAGRTFAKDEPVKETRTVISKRVADLLWPGQNAVGRTIILWKGQGDQRGEVIGVVGNMRERGLENDPTMAVYFAANPDSGRTVMDLVIRTRTEPTSITPDLRAAIVAIDPKVPVSDVRSLDDMVATSVATRRFTMLLLAGFAVLALILALAGVGGVLAYTIARRTPEIGLRLALGAEHYGLLRFVLLQGLRPVAMGLVIGLGATFWLSTLMSSLLFGIRPGDPTTYLVVSALLIATTIAACYVPARRVLSVDPSISLRTD